MRAIYAVPYLSKVYEAKMKELEERFDSIFITVMPDDKKADIVLVNCTNLSFSSLSESRDVLEEIYFPESEILFQLFDDEELGDVERVTLLVTGFDE